MHATLQQKRFSSPNCSKYFISYWVVPPPVHIFNKHCFLQPAINNVPLRKLIPSLLLVLLNAVMQAQAPCLSPSRAEVLPVFFVPQGVAFPDYTEQSNRIQQHLQWSKNRYREMLGNRSTFTIADTGAITFYGRRPDSYYKSFEDRGAAAYAEELLPHLGYTRFNCPYILLVIYIDYTTNFPVAGARTLNGGINNGGGIIIMSGADLKFSPVFQSTLQHELGHSFSLPHVNSYGYSMDTNASIMSYNLSHQTNFFTPSNSPGILIPEDVRNLALNKLAFPGLYFDSATDIPSGYAIYPHIPLVGIMDIPGQSNYKVTAVTNSGETYSSAVGNMLQNEIKLSYPGMPFAYDAGNMWHSGEVNGWASAEIKFPVTVTIDKVGIHTQHSGLYQKADSIRIEAYNSGAYTVLLERPLPDVDEYISFNPVTDSIFRFSFKPGITRMVTVRGIEFFNNHEPVFAPAVPYVLRDPQRNLLPSKPQLVFPADSATINSFLIPLSWTGARSNRYKLQVDTCKDFCAPVFETLTNTGSCSLSVTIPGKRYYWRVKGLNNTGQGFGEWSSIRYFLPQATAVYTFTGNGSYFTASNWLNNSVPPNPVPAGTAVRIQSSNSDECVVDQPVSFSPGAALQVSSNARLRLAQNVHIQ